MTIGRAAFVIGAVATPAALATPRALASAPQASTMPGTMLAWAQRLVAELSPANNVYGSHPTHVVWSDPQTGRIASNRSVCSSFVNHLLEHSFGYTPDDFAAWFGSRVPHAKDYETTIAARHGFLHIVHVRAIRPGDIIAVRFPAGSNPTGHVMIAASVARARTALAPIVDGTQQYDIDIIDSAASGHGPGDTRYHAKAPWTTGVGRGVLRLYAWPDDTIAGYAWSTSERSLFRSASERVPAIGRLDSARVPHPSGTTQATDVPDDADYAGDARPGGP